MVEPRRIVLPLGIDAAEVSFRNHHYPRGYAVGINTAALVWSWRSLFKGIRSWRQIGDLGNSFAVDRPVLVESEGLGESRGVYRQLAEAEAVPAFQNTFQRRTAMNALSCL